MAEDKVGDLFQGFSKLARKERFARLEQLGALTHEDIRFLQTKSGLNPDLAENLIENVIGYFQMPLGVATNFRIDGKDYAIPMAVEETSIIAAVSKTAKWIRQEGSITTETIGDQIIGQIQLAKVKDPERTSKVILANKDFLMQIANDEVASAMVKRGGGVKNIDVREIKRDDGQSMLVMHVYANTCDAMGANVVTQICEYLKPHIENLTDEKVTMCILSNLIDTKITKAKVVIRNVAPELGEALSEAAIFANADPYRACTNNKGALNGMDPVLLATGNDWRAVEAGVHAYAARSGQYRSITNWYMNGSNLVGELEAPIAVGIVGGVTKVHPTAQLCLRMLDVGSAAELSQVVAACGLVQNLGAIKALTTFGFIEGHMKLHATNLALGAGAEGKEVPLLKKRLEEILALRKRITLSNAIDLLFEIRSELTTQENPLESKTSEKV